MRSRIAFGMTICPRSETTVFIPEVYEIIPTGQATDAEGPASDGRDREPNANRQVGDRTVALETGVQELGARLLLGVPAGAPRWHQARRRRREAASSDNPRSHGARARAGAERHPQPLSDEPLDGVPVCPAAPPAGSAPVPPEPTGASTHAWFRQTSQKLQSASDPQLVGHSSTVESQT